MTKIAIAQLFIWLNFQLVLDIFIGSDDKDSPTVIEKNNLLQRHLSSIIKNTRQKRKVFSHNESESIFAKSKNIHHIRCSSDDHRRSFEML